MSGPMVLDPGPGPCPGPNPGLDQILGQVQDQVTQVQDLRPVCDIQSWKKLLDHHFFFTFLFILIPGTTKRHHVTKTDRKENTECIKAVFLAVQRHSY